MASNPLFIILPDFFCIFPMNFAMATLGLKEMGKFLCEFCWLSQFSKVHWENEKRNSGIMISGLNAMPLFLLDDLLNKLI